MLEKSYYYFLIARACFESLVKGLALTRACLDSTLQLLNNHCNHLVIITNSAAIEEGKMHIFI